MAKRGLAFAVVALLAVWSVAASAGVIYDNGTPDLNVGYFSDSQNAGAGTIYKAYDDFSVASDTTITDVHWWGFYYTGNTPPASGDSFLYSIRTSPGAGGQPGAEIASGALTGLVRTDTGAVDQGAYEVYKYDAILAPTVPLSAGEYYLSVYDTILNTGNAFTWAASSEAPGSDNEWSFDGSNWVEAPQTELAFNLTDDAQVAPVPEPATMTLLGLGLAGLVGRSIRKRAGK